jgi:hypothetical protein
MDANTDDQARDAYAHHQATLEAVLLGMLAGRKRYAVAYRPRWWWLCSPDAESYRANPAEFEDPRDINPTTVALEPGVRDSLHRRQVELVGRVHYLARQGLLERWEELHIVTRGGVRARALTEELARRERR